MLDIISILMFFVFYKVYNIYMATFSIIILSLVNILYLKIRYKRLQKQKIFMVLVILIFGSATLFFRNDMFIKWKITIIYGIAGIFCLFTYCFKKQPFLKYLFKSKCNFSDIAWINVNLSCSIYFIFISILNLYIAYYYSTNIWINFKFFYVPIFTLLFVFFIIYIYNK